MSDVQIEIDPRLSKPPFVQGLTDPPEGVTSYSGAGDSGDTSGGGVTVQVPVTPGNGQPYSFHVASQSLVMDEFQNISVSVVIEIDNDDPNSTYSARLADG